MLGIIVGTGPSLTAAIPAIHHLRNSRGALVFTCNNTYKDVQTDIWLACDPAWHEHYGQVTGNFVKWHWDKGICQRYGYQYIRGVWICGDKVYPRDEVTVPPGPVGGLWLKDKSSISLNHCSAAQLLNLAVHYELEPILLVGHDFNYELGKPRHYFSDLSDKAGEYPPELRKFSLFDKQGKGDDLLAVYKRIADQEGRPTIINATPGSKLPWFPKRELCEFM